MSETVVPVKVLNITSWTPTLFSFTVSRPTSFRFSAGQFVRLGVNPSTLNYYQQQNKNVGSKADIFRAYSIVSSPYEENLEFFSIVIPDGAFTSQLQHLQVGDSLLLNMTPFGFLTLARYQQPAPKDLWLLATGTGLAPFLSILQDLQVWQDYEHIVLAYCARTQDELAYQQRINQLAQEVGDLVNTPAKFTYIPIVTRKQTEGMLNQRLPKLLASHQLQNKAGIELNSNTSHIMLCGNPQMVNDTKETLKSMGLTMNRRGVGNIAVENYW